MQNTSRWGHNDHGNKMIIEECRRTASIACRTTVSMSAVQRTQSVQATPTHRAGHGHAVIMPAPPHTASAASRRLVPTHPRAATTSTREGFTRGGSRAKKNFGNRSSNDHSCHVSFMASMSELSPPLVSHLRHRKAAQRRHTRSTLSQHKPGRPKSEASLT